MIAAASVSPCTPPRPLTRSFDALRTSASSDGSFAFPIALRSVFGSRGSRRFGERPGSIASLRLVTWGRVRERGASCEEECGQVELAVRDVPVKWPRTVCLLEALAFAPYLGAKAGWRSVGLVCKKMRYDDWVYALHDLRRYLLSDLSLICKNCLEGLAPPCKHGQERAQLRRSLAR